MLTKPIRFYQSKVFNRGKSQAIVDGKQSEL